MDRSSDFTSTVSIACLTSVGNGPVTRRPGLYLVGHHLEAVIAWKADIGAIRQHPRTAFHARSPVLNNVRFFTSAEFGLRAIGG